MFITPALAQTTSAPGGSSIILQLMPFILIFAIMYFLIIRPQQKRLKAHREMVANVQRGDTVVTAGGLVGKVSRVVDDDEVQVDIADGVRVSVVRSTLSEVRPKGEVRGANKAAKSSEADSKETAKVTTDNAKEGASKPAQAKTAKSANGAAKKPAARKTRSSSSSSSTRKSTTSPASKAGATKSSTSSRTRRSRAKTDNGSAGEEKETGESGNT